MRVVIEEVPESGEEQVIIRCKKLSSRYLRAIEILKAQDHIVGYKDTAIYKIDPDDILYFEAVDKRIFVYTAADVYETKHKLTQAEHSMGDDFVRISRVVVLNWRKIESLRPMLNGRLEALLCNDEKLVISRQYVAELKRRFMRNQE